MRGEKNNSMEIKRKKLVSQMAESNKEEKSMLNENNRESHYEEELAPMREKKLGKSSFACRRPVGTGYTANGKTYVAYNGRGMDVYLCIYDHVSDTWSEEKVWTNNMFGRWDYHNYVTLVQAPDGEPVMFQAKHSDSLYMIKKNAVGEWICRKISEDRNGYPAPVVANGCMYVFYSRNQEISYPYRPYCYVCSEDNGATWSEPKVVIDSEKMTGSKIDEVYMCGTRFIPADDGYPDRILFSWGMWGGPKGHADPGPGAFGAQMYLDTREMYTMDGIKIGKTIGYKDMIQKCFVYDFVSKTEFLRTVYGPVIDFDKEAVLVYGVKESDGTTVLKEAVRRDGKFVVTSIAEGIYNVEDMRKTTSGLEIVVGVGDALVLYCRKENGNWQRTSVTKVQLDDNADSFTYASFFPETKEKNAPKVLLGQIENADIDGYYEGKWDTVLYF